MGKRLRNQWNRLSGFARWSLLAELVLLAVVVATFLAMSHKVAANPATGSTPGMLSIHWGDPAVTAGDHANVGGPSWFVSAFKVGGVWDAQTPAWRVAAEDTDSTRALIVSFDPVTVPKNLTLRQRLLDTAGGVLTVDLLDANRNPVAINLSGNLIQGLGGIREVVTAISLAPYPNATAIRLHRERGEIVLLETTLSALFDSPTIVPIADTPASTVTVPATSPENSSATPVTPTVASVSSVNRLALNQIQAQLHDYLGPVFRQTFRAQLKSSSPVDPAKLAALDPDDFCAYAAVLNGIDPVEAGLLIRNWFDNTATLAKSSPRQLARLAALAGKVRPSDLLDYSLTREQVMLVESQIAVVYAQNKADFDMLNDLSRACLAVCEFDKASEWAVHACNWVIGTEAKQQAVTLDVIRPVADLLRDTGTTTNSQTSAALAATLAQLAQKSLDLEPGDADRFSLAARTPEGRRILDAALETNGVPNVAIGKIIGGTSKDNPAVFRSWQTILDAKIASTAGDIRAGWLSIRGYMDMYAVTPRQSLRRFAWIAQAQKTVVSAEAKRAATLELVEFYREQNRSELAIKSLEDASLGGDPNIAARLARTREEAAQRQVDAARRNQLCEEVRGNRRGQP